MARLPTPVARLVEAVAATLGSRPEPAGGGGDERETPGTEVDGREAAGEETGDRRTAEADRRTGTEPGDDEPFDLDRDDVTVEIVEPGDGPTGDGSADGGDDGKPA